jgi:hypothetical protein
MIKMRMKDEISEELKKVIENGIVPEYFDDRARKLVDEIDELYASGKYKLVIKEIIKEKLDKLSNDSWIVGFNEQ